MRHSIGRSNWPRNIMPNYAWSCCRRDRRALGRRGRGATRPHLGRPGPCKRQAAGALRAGGGKCRMQSRAGASIRETARRKTSDLIADEAQTWCADLIVIGSRGRGPIRRAVLGSVDAAVARVASMPVLSVRASQAARPGRRSRPKCRLRRRARSDWPELATLAVARRPRFDGSPYPAAPWTQANLTRI